VIAGRTPRQTSFPALRRRRARHPPDNAKEVVSWCNRFASTEEALGMDGNSFPVVTSYDGILPRENQNERIREIRPPLSGSASVERSGLPAR
jgi:hypothetical protein